jgi:hypothetical protein
VGQDLYDKVKASAAAEGRTITNFLDFYLRRAMMSARSAPFGCTCTFLGGIHSNDCALHGQVDIETAIAAAVKRGPVTSKAAKHK